MGDLRDDDLTRIAGKWDELVGLIQERYGRSYAEAEGEVNEFRNGL